MLMIFASLAEPDPQTDTVELSNTAKAPIHTEQIPQFRYELKRLGFLLQTLGAERERER